MGNSANPCKLFAVGDELCHALGNLAAAIQERNAEITYDKLPTIQGNPGTFLRLLQNLIANALKFQKENVSPRVHVGVEELPEFWRFSITDNGIGMDQEGAKVIFEPFRRLHSCPLRKTKYSSTPTSCP